MPLQCDVVQDLDLLRVEERRLFAHWLSLCISSACRSKTCLADCSKVLRSIVRSDRTDSISWMKPTTLARSSGGSALIWSITSYAVMSSKSYGPIASSASSSSASVSPTSISCCRRSLKLPSKGDTRPRSYRVRKAIIGFSSERALTGFHQKSLVLRKGLEPLRLTAHAPQTCVSTNST